MKTSSHIAMTLHRSRKNDQNDDHVNTSTTHDDQRDRANADHDCAERKRHPLKARQHPCHQRDNQDAQHFCQQIPPVRQRPEDRKRNRQYRQCHQLHDDQPRNDRHLAALFHRDPQYPSTCPRHV